MRIKEGSLEKKVKYLTDKRVYFVELPQRILQKLRQNGYHLSSRPECFQRSNFSLSWNCTFRVHYMLRKWVVKVLMKKITWPVKYLNLILVILVLYANSSNEIILCSFRALFTHWSQCSLTKKLKSINFISEMRRGMKQLL